MRADEGVLIKNIWLFGTSLADKTAAKMIRADQGCSGMFVRKFGAVLWRGTGGMVLAYNKPP